VPNVIPEFPLPPLQPPPPQSLNIPESILQQQQQKKQLCQPPENDVIQNRDVFLPTPSSAGEESITQELTSSSNLQKDQEYVNAGYLQSDTVGTDTLKYTLEDLVSDNEGIPSTSSDDIYAVKVRTWNCM
jgi:hypothetical protein